MHSLVSLLIFETDTFWVDILDEWVRFGDSKEGYSMFRNIDEDINFYCNVAINGASYILREKRIGFESVNLETEIVSWVRHI